MKKNGYIFRVTHLEGTPMRATVQFIESMSSEIFMVREVYSCEERSQENLDYEEIFGDTNCVVNMSYSELILSPNINNRIHNKMILYFISDLIRDKSDEWYHCTSTTDEEDEGLFNITCSAVKEFNKFLEICDDIVETEIFIEFSEEGYLTKLEFCNIEDLSDILNKIDFIPSTTHKFKISLEDIDKALLINKPTTFGNILFPTHEQQLKYYGFLYRIRLFDKVYSQLAYTYYGQKSFGKTDHWKTYTSSSEHVNNFINSGAYHVKYEVFGIYFNKEDLLEDERRTIRYAWLYEDSYNINYCILDNYGNREMKYSNSYSYSPKKYTWKNGKRRYSRY